MLSENIPQKLLIIGVHSKTDGYPNVKYRIADLLSNPLLDTTEVNYPFAERIYQAYDGRFSRLMTVGRAMLSHLKIMLYLIRQPKQDLIYIPYPAIFVAWCITLLPKRTRPTRIYLDAFISIYDTVINDRALLARDSWSARLLYKIERRAYENADLVITDTSQNESFFRELFRLDPRSLTAIPLSTDETVQQQTQPDDSASPSINVLFTGTLVPLHGIETILEAVAACDDSRIRFTIIGDGQMGYLVEQHQTKYPNSLTWHKQWRAKEEISTAITDADICLGTFGHTDKAQRVCPLKLYAYCFHGKAVITGETVWTESVTKSRTQKPFLTISADNSAHQLISNIKRLINNPTEIDMLRRESSNFYQTELSNEIAINKLLSQFLSGTHSE